MITIGEDDAEPAYTEWLGTYTFTGLADVTQDGKVTAADAMNILRYTIKLKTSSNTGEKVDIPKELLSKEQ